MISWDGGMKRLYYVYNPSTSISFILPRPIRLLLLGSSATFTFTIVNSSYLVEEKVKRVKYQEQGYKRCWSCIQRFFYCHKFWRRLRQYEDQRETVIEIGLQIKSLTWCRWHWWTGLSEQSNTWIIQLPIWLKMSIAWFTVVTAKNSGIDICTKYKLCHLKSVRGVF